MKIWFKKNPFYSFIPFVTMGMIDDFSVFIKMGFDMQQCLQFTLFM